MMRQDQSHFEVRTQGKGLIEITRDVAAIVADTGIATGVLTLFCRHTSCSLIIQENADPDVQADLKEFFEQLAPENMNWVRHRSEGSDDMPAHIRAALTQTTVSIPLVDGRLALGTWQGIYLFEHRKHPHRRRLIVHVMGEE